MAAETGMVVPDNEAVLGVGLSFPLRFGDLNGQAAESSGTRRINESFWQILSTPKGTRLRRPNFGIRMDEMLHQPIGEQLRGVILFYVEDAVRWEKRATIGEVTFLSRFNLRDLEYPQLVDDVLAACELMEQGIELVNIPYRTITSQVIGNCVFPFYFDSDMRLMGYGYYIVSREETIVDELRIQ